MADLDSFFAKRGKKKVKGMKFTSTDEMAKRLEDSEKKLEKEFHEKAPTTKPIEEVSEEKDEVTGVITVVEVKKQPTKKQEEEEWNDYEVKAKEVFDDLKIGRLQIDDDEEGGGCGGNMEGREEGEDGEDGKDGVWKTGKPPPPPPVPEVEPELDEESKLADLPSVVGGSYVPPHMRNVSAPSHLPRGGGGGYKKSKLAPDITNEMAFPSLSDATATNPAGAWGRKKFDDRQGFENVRHGSVRAAQDEFNHPKLSTANRFDALTDHS